MFMKKLFLLLSISVTMFSCSDNNEIGRYQYIQVNDFGVAFDTKTGIGYYMFDEKLYILDYPKGEERQIPLKKRVK